MSEQITDWVGRKVKIVDGFEGSIGQVGVVLAVDDTPYRPSAWVKIKLERDYPSYRSCDLCWLEDVETEEQGPVWGTGGPDAHMAEHRP